MQYPFLEFSYLKSANEVLTAADTYNLDNLYLMPNFPYYNFNLADTVVRARIRVINWDAADGSKDAEDAVLMRRALKK